MKPIPYGRQSITEEDIQAVIETLQSDFLTQGPKIAEFENDFAKYVGAQYAVAVSNGTAALHLSAMAVGVQPDDNVIVTPVTFVASANCVRYCGGNVVFCDIDRDTYLLDMEKLKQMLASKPKGYYKGIIPVDFAGYPVHGEKLREIADEYGLWIIEDACHAPGAWFTDNKEEKQLAGNGKFAELTCFSFHPVKHIATGEGGMITTNSKTLYEKLMLYRTHGITKDPDLLNENHGGWYYEMLELGYNYRLTDFQAALGISQLKRANSGLVRRQEIARRYHEAFKDIIGIITPKICQDIYHAYHLYIIQVEDRLGLYNYLKENNIHAQVHYEPVHLQPYYRKLENKSGDMPIAEDFYRHCLSLPMYPTLTHEEQEYVINAVKEFISKENENHIKISIVVPVYNVEKYLRQCLDSLVNQTLKEIEIICVNDASPDNSLEILQEYAQKDNRIIIINLKENRKQGGARNAGIQIARGEYIGIVDSDDWVDINMYESLWNASSDGTIDMVCSDYYTYYEESKKVIFTENIPDSIIEGTIEDIHKHVIVNGGRMWTNIIKKRLFFDYQLFYPENLIYEDNAIGGSLYCVAKTISKVSKPLYYYRIRKTSTTNTRDNLRLFDRLETSIMMLEHTKRLSLYKRYPAEIDYSFYYLYYKNTLSDCFFGFSTTQRKYIDVVKENFPKYILLSTIYKNKYYQRKKNYRDVFYRLLQWNTDVGIWLFTCLIGIARKIRKIKKTF